MGDRGGCAKQLAFAVAAGVLLSPVASRADEGGVSFWLPGTFGSLAAVPGQPGMSLATFYYHTSVSASGDVAAAREITIGKLNSTLNVNLSASLKSDANLLYLGPTYTFSSPVLGGQASISLGTFTGENSTSLSGTLTASLPPFTLIRSDSISDSASGFGDLYPTATLKWNEGVNNFMVYGMGDIPVGAYNSKRLSNLGIGHGAADLGGGYTYLNQTNGEEVSAVAGFTYNLENTSTNYQNGVDFHLDWAASQFLSEHFSLGPAGYIYQQVGCDTGSGDKVGCFRSRVIGLGPQISYLFPIGNMQGYLNLKAYGEFAARARPDGWNTWLTFSISF